MTKINKENEIDYLPELPIEIKEAINKRRLILFVGAGASNQIELPLWKDLADASIKKCFEEGYIDDGDRKLIINTIKDNKEKLSIAFELFEDRDNEESLYKFFDEKLKSGEYEKEKATIYSFCDFVKTQVLSTNADLVIDDFFQDGLIVYELEEMKNNLKTKPAVFKIHGSLVERNSLVFTTKEYIKRYGHGTFIEFLNSIFHSGNTILFLGYGLGEFELLDIILEKLTDKKGDYYIVNGYYSYEKAIERSRKLYFKSLGVKQISFCMDKKGYNQLDDVLEKWKKEIKDETELRPNIYKDIRKAVKDKKYTLAIQLISDSRDAKRFFLDEIWRQNIVVEWFKYLYKKKLLDVSTVKDYWYEMRFVENSIELLLDEDVGLKEKVIDLVKKAAISLMREGEYGKRSNNISIIDELLVLFDHNILGKKLKEYLNLVEKTNDRIAGLLYRVCEDDSRIKEWDESDILAIFELILPDENDINYEKNVWEQCNFIEKLSAFYIKEFPEKITNMVIDWFAKNERHIYLSLLSAGAIAFIEEKERHELDNKEKELVIVLKRIIERNEEIAKKYCEEYSNENSLDDLFGQLTIYSINIHYKKLKNYLYSREDNPFNNIYYYGDLYSLIKNNLDIISEDEKDTLYKWIMDAEFGEFGEEYKKVLKYDLLMLFSRRWHNYLAVANSFKVDNYSEFPSIINRSKKSYTVVKTIKESSDLLEKLKTMDLFDSMSYVQQELNKEGMDKHIVNKTVEKYLNDIDLRECSNSEITQVVPTEYYYDIAETINETETVETVERDYELFEIIKDYYLSCENEEDKLFSVCDCISKPNVKINKMIAPIIKKAIYSLIEDDDIMSKYLGWIDDYTSKASWLKMQWLCSATSSLLDIDLLQEENNIKGLFELLSLKNESIAKIVFALNLDKIKKLDSSWLYENLSLLLDDDDAYIASILFNNINLEIYGLVKEKKNETIVENANQDEKDYIVDSIMRYSIYYALFHEIELDKFGIEWLKQYKLAAYKESFSFLDLCVKSDFKKEHIKDIIRTIIEVFSNEISNLEDDTTDVVTEYCNLILSLEGAVQVEWKLLDNVVKKSGQTIPLHLTKLLKGNLSNDKREIARVLTTIARKSNAGVIKYNDDYMELVMEIKNDKTMSKEFSKLNNALIDLGITDFID